MKKNKVLLVVLALFMVLASCGNGTTGGAFDPAVLQGTWRWVLGTMGGVPDYDVVITADTLKWAGDAPATITSVTETHISLSYPNGYEPSIPYVYYNNTLMLRGGDGIWQQRERLTSGYNLDNRRYITVTGIPAEYDGMYMIFRAERRDQFRDMDIWGVQGNNSSGDMILPQISNGSVEIPVWYTGSETFGSPVFSLYFYVYDRSAIKNLDEPWQKLFTTPSISFSSDRTATVPFSSLRLRN